MSTEDLGTVLTTDPIIVDPTTATGDMLYRDAGGDVVELAVGADTQVLTLAAGLPSWAAAAGGSTTFYCLLSKQANQAISVSGLITFGAGSEIYDAEGFHDTSTNTERMTVPAGEDGLYLIGCNLLWDTNTSGGRMVDLTLYDASAAATIKIGQQLNVSTQVNAGPATISVIWPLEENDYIYISVGESSSGSPAVRARTNLWLYRLQT